MQEDSNHETSQIIVDTSANTVYNNTLTIKGREGGVYTCTVGNNILDFVSYLRSSIIFTFRVEGKNLVRILVQHPYYICSLLFFPAHYTVAETPTQFTAIYRSATSILLEWTYTLTPETTTGYIYVIYYEYAGDSDVPVSTGNVNNTYLLTGLPIGGVHSISIVALRHLPSDVVGPVDPGLCSHA